MIERSDKTNPRSGIDTGASDRLRPRARQGERIAGQNLKFPPGECSSLKEPVGLQSHMGYKLAEGVQVRQEKFGLLFYNYRGPRLYFVPSKKLIGSDFFYGNKRVSELIEYICTRDGKPRALMRQRIMQILEVLEIKGLIYGQSIC